MNHDDGGATGLGTARSLRFPSRSHASRAMRGRCAFHIRGLPVYIDYYVIVNGSLNLTTLIWPTLAGNVLDPTPSAERWRVLEIGLLTISIIPFWRHRVPTRRYRGEGDIRLDRVGHVVNFGFGASRRLSGVNVGLLA